MKLKTKTKILLGALITSILIPYAGVFSPVNATVGKDSLFKKNASLQRMHKSRARAKQREGMLYVAIQNSDKKAIRNLRTQYPRININTRRTHPGRYTPLHYAVFYRDLDITEFLIKKCGADPTVKNGRGLTPYGLAKEFGLTDVINLLEELGIRR